MTALKLLFFDVETAPLLAHIWRPYDAYIPHDRIIHDSFMLTWAAKWSDDKWIHSSVVTPEEARAQDDERIVTELAGLIRAADVVVAHNIDNFDIPMLNNRLLAMKLEPLGPVRTIDTLQLAKRNFRLAYNKLDYLGEFLGLGRKIKTDFDLWRDCYHGDEKALKKMAKYNSQDVTLLEKVFDALKPYVRNLPRLHEGDGEQHICPSCGGEEFTRQGFYITQASTFQRVKCSNCLRYSRYRVAIKSKRLPLHPL